MKLNEEILQILADNNITQTWLARELSVSNQVLSYHLNNQINDMSYELYYNSKKIFEKSGYVLPEQKANQFEQLVIGFNGTVNFTLANLNQEIYKSLKDGRLAYSEKARIKFQIDRLRISLEKNLSEIEMFLDD